MVTRNLQIIRNLKSKDDRKKRRAIRDLFEIDEDVNLEYFIPLLDDKDQWYRSKAVDAFRRWAKRKDISCLEVLVNHQNIEYNRVAANLLPFFKNEPSDIAKSLFLKDDYICKLKASEFILQNKNEDSFYQELMLHENPRLRIVGLRSEYLESEKLNDALDDESKMVVEAALERLQELDLPIAREYVPKLLKRDIKRKLLINHVIELGGDSLSSLIQNSKPSTKKEVVKILRQNYNKIDDSPIISLIKNGHLMVVGRWLQGKKGREFDRLRWEIIEDSSLDEIERCRLLERLFSRCNEKEIRERAQQLSQTIQSDLIKTTAHNLSTADDRV